MKKNCCCRSRTELENLKLIIQHRKPLRPQIKSCEAVRITHNPTTETIRIIGTVQAIVCPATVELSTLFDGEAVHRTPVLALRLLTELHLTTAEDLYTTHPKLFAASIDEAELKKLSGKMKATGEAMNPQVIWNTDENTDLRKVEIMLLRRVIRRANQQHQASLTFDKAEAQRKEQKRLLKEEQLSAAKASERDAQLSMKLHNDLMGSCCYKVAPSDQAPPEVVVKLYNALLSGTLCAADLELKKYVLRSQALDAKDHKTRLGEDGELTLVTKEDALINTVSVSDVLIAAKT